MKSDLLFVHGFFGSGRNWGPIKIKLQKDFSSINIHTPSLLGHDSQWLSSDYKTSLSENKISHEDLIAEDLLLKLDDLNPSPLHAIGHSYGIRPLIKILHKHPHRFLSLTILDALPEISHHGSSLLKSILDIELQNFSNRDSFRDFVNQKYNTSIANFLISQLKSSSETPLSWRFDKEFLNEVLREATQTSLYNELNSIQIPLSLFYGLKSEHFQTSKLSQITLPYTLHEIPEAGHWIHADQPEIVVKKLKDILF